MNKLWNAQHITPYSNQTSKETLWYIITEENQNSPYIRPLLLTFKYTNQRSWSHMPFIRLFKRVSFSHCGDCIDIHEKGFQMLKIKIECKKINSMKIFVSLSSNLPQKFGRHVSPGSKAVALFWLKISRPSAMKPRILELSVSRDLLVMQMPYVRLS